MSHLNNQLCILVKVSAGIKVYLDDPYPAVKYLRQSRLIQKARGQDFFVLTPKGKKALFYLQNVLAGFL